MDVSHATSNQVVPESAQRSSLRYLAPEKIVDTIGQLARRIEERFPTSGLATIAGELHRISADAMVRAEQIRRPDWRLRFAIGVLLLGVLAVLGQVVTKIELGDDLFQVEHFVQIVDSSLASLVIIGAVIASLVTLEVRLKRQRALAAIRELRSLAHIVDMHQLTKDPERATGQGTSTDSSPKRVLSPFLLGRYLDYCSELLSLISKVAAIYVQDFPDTVALEAVDQLSNLTNGLSRNIWQKIMILESIAGPQVPPQTE